MEESKEKKYDYLFDDRELDNESGNDIDLTDKELEQLLDEEETKELKDKLDKIKFNGSTQK